MKEIYSLRGFEFHKVSSGQYRVTYESDYDFKVGRYYEAFINDMTIIDATKNCESPKACDIAMLKRIVKSGKLIKLNH